MISSANYFIMVVVFKRTLKLILEKRKRKRKRRFIYFFLKSIKDEKSHNIQKITYNILLVSPSAHLEGGKKMQRGVINSRWVMGFIFYFFLCLFF